MAEITASLVKELREKTGAGMMDCKKALGETAGDIEAAVDWLRTKGLAAAAKKAGIGKTTLLNLIGGIDKPTSGKVIIDGVELSFLKSDEFPTSEPTSDPTEFPTSAPTSNPTEYPTSNPTANPTSAPTSTPTANPTSTPTSTPTEYPSSNPITK